MNTSVKVVVFTSDQTLIPVPATSRSAGLDLKANIEEDVVIAPMKRVKLPTGLCFHIPQGYEGHVCSRSGLAWKHGVVVLNGPGIIDSDYRDEIQVLLVNLSDESFTITPKMRIAQILFKQTIAVEWDVALQPLKKDTSRTGGLGSTGYHDLPSGT